MLDRLHLGKAEDVFPHLDTILSRCVPFPREIDPLDLGHLVPQVRRGEERIRAAQGGRRQERDEQEERVKRRQERQCAVW